MNPAIVTLAIMILLGADLPSFAKTTGTPKVKAWQISQNSQLGLTNWLISDSGIKVTLPAHRVTWTCAAPSWKVLVYNAKSNIGLQQDLSPYGSVRSPTVEQGTIDTASVVKTKTHYQGRPATKVVARVIASDPAAEKFEMMYQEAQSRSDTFGRVEFLYENWIPLKPQLSAFLCGYYKDSVDGVRLEQVLVYATRRRSVLSTISVGETMVPVSEFTYPTGFRPVNKMHEIMQEKDKAREFTGVIEDLFLDTDVKPKTKGK